MLKAGSIALYNDEELVVIESIVPSENSDKVYFYDKDGEYRMDRLIHFEQLVHTSKEISTALNIVISRLEDK